MRRRVGAASALALALAACPSPEQDAVRAVRAYDDELVRAYRGGDASSMGRVAAPEEAARVRVLVDLKSAGRLVLESTLEAFEATRARVEPGGRAATVETRERWRWLDRHLRPGEAPGPAAVSEMTMRYDLARDGGGWKVRAVTTLSSRPVEGARDAGRAGDAGDARRG